MLGSVIGRCDRSIAYNRLDAPGSYASSVACRHAHDPAMYGGTSLRPTTYIQWARPIRTYSIEAIGLDNHNVLIPLRGLDSSFVLATEEAAFGRA